MDLVANEPPLQRIRELSTIPFARQLVFILGLSASLALALSVVLWSQKENYVPLYPGMDPAASSEIVSVLERNGSQYRIDPRTGSIQVPADTVHQMRMFIASEGAMVADAGGFSILKDEPQLGLSGFMERARYDHALEEELVRTISAIEAIRNARVHLSRPNQSGFIRNSARPAASVLINLYPGRSLSKRQIQGIRHLVSASVPELLAEDVSVVDQDGALLSESPDDAGLAAGLERLEITKAIEGSYVDRIMDILVPITGRAGVRAQVSAELDLTHFESTRESYSPDEFVRSEQIEQERNQVTDRNGGVPGTLANEPPTAPELTAGGAAANPGNDQNSSSSRTVRNYELGKTISHERQSPGTIKRLSIAVVIDQKTVTAADGTITKEAYSQAELDNLTELVRQAVGYQQARGDTVTLNSVSFVGPEIFEDLEPPSLLETPWVWQAARMAVAVLVCLILIFAVIRPAMRSSTKSLQVTQNKAALAAPEQDNGVQGKKSAKADKSTALESKGNEANKNQENLALGLDSKAHGEEGKTVPHALIETQPVPLYRHQLDSARELLEQQPEAVAHVIKHWVTANE